MQNKIDLLKKESIKAGITKEIPRVVWLKEDLKLMKVACKEDECPQPRCESMQKRHDL